MLSARACSGIKPVAISVNVMHAPPAQVSPDGKRIFSAIHLPFNGGEAGNAGTRPDESHTACLYGE